LQALLASFTDAGEENLTGIFVVKRIVHLAEGLCGAAFSFATRFRGDAMFMIAPKFEGEATPLCYASSEPLEA
jgi:hypothetical protein